MAKGNKICRINDKPEVIIKFKDNLMYFEVKLSKALEKQLEKTINETSGTITLSN